MKKVLIGSMIAASLFILVPNHSFALTSIYTTDEAIQQYQQNYENYQSDEHVKIKQYRENYQNIKGSLADKVIERAIWYMENGYSVYGHGLASYHTNGILDCSEFTRLVYGDFKFAMTDIAANYASVGTPIEGVKPVNENGKWKLEGTEHLLPGDILTWWDLDEDGQKYISHVAIYMGELNGQPAVIGTTSANNPTALGIVNNFNYWYGENFFSAQRVLPEGAWSPDVTFPDHPEKPPVIPESYVLPPQRDIPIPDLDPADYQSTEPIVLTKQGWVAVYESPSINSTKVGRLEFNQEARIIKKYNSYWFEIEFNGQTAYITTSPEFIKTENYVDPEPPVYTEPVVLTNYGWVSIFAGPSTQSETLGRLQYGEGIPLIKQYNPYWYEVKYNDQTAYITANSKYTHTENYYPEVEVQQELTEYLGPAVLTNSGWVSVFERPDTESQSIGKLYLNESAPLIRQLNEHWYEIKFNGQIAYITANSKYTHTKNYNPEVSYEPEYTGPVVATNSGWVSIFSGPSTNSETLGRLYLGERAPLIRPYNTWWYEIKYNDQTAYITANEKYTHTENYDPEPEITGPAVLTNSGWVTVFSKPSTNSEPLGKLQYGQSAPLIKKYNSWYYEVTFNGQTGYITTNEKYTHTENWTEPEPVPEPEITGPVVMTNKGWVTVFSKPSTNSEPLGRLQLEEQAPLIKKYNSWYYEIEFYGQTGYITTSETYTRVEEIQ